VYQSSKGGKIYVPLDHDARILRSCTPKFAKSISSKYSLMSTRQVITDFSENHGRLISRDYVQRLSEDLGHQIEQAEQRWSYTLPEAVIKETKVVGIGRDGTTTHIKGEGYRETMSGTISFYNKNGERLHTIYQAQAPEYGKMSFDNRFTERIEEVKANLKPLGLNKNDDCKGVSYIGLADGAKDNWSFLETHTDVSILDFWHACEYLTLASKMVSKSVHLQKQWLSNARTRLKENENGAQDLLDEIKTFQKKRKFSKMAREGLQRSITYFQNHVYQMNYFFYEKENYPIGSGVTEAACKVIVKQRLSCSGMSWTIKSAQNVLNIRALRYSGGQWQQFWTNIDKFGFHPN